MFGARLKLWSSYINARGLFKIPEDFGKAGEKKGDKKDHKGTPLQK